MKTNAVIHTIWDENINMDAWESYRVECELEDNIKIDPNSHEWYNRVTELNYQYLDDERMNLNISTDGEIIAIADLGFWYGRRKGVTFLGNNVANCLRSSVNGQSECHFYVEGNEMKGREGHHDGVNYYIYREININDFSDAEIEVFYDKLKDGVFTKDDINKYTKPIGHYANEVYGWNIG